MTKFIAIASGKGGVGKTTAVINLATALAYFGRHSIALDANFATPNISLFLGYPNLEHSIHDALEQKKSIREVVYKHPSGLRIIPGRINHHPLKTININYFEPLIKELNDATEIVFIDAPNALNKEFIKVLRASDYTLFLTTADLASVANTLKAMNLARENLVNILGIVINKATESNLDMSIKNIEAILGGKVVATIPKDSSIETSIMLKQPVVYSFPESRSSIEFKKLAAKIIGEKYVENIEKKEKNSMFNYMLKMLGLSK